MSQTLTAGDYLVFQLESGYGLLRILAAEGEHTDRVWHLSVYEELFPDVESAEQALARPESLHARDRKSTRLNSSHLVISYAVFCLKKKKSELVEMTSSRY